MAWTRKGYVYEGLKGWTVAFWNAREGEVRYLHGYATVQEAVGELERCWDNPPLLQDGFPTGVRIHER